MALSLEKYGITGATEVICNPSYEELFQAEMDPTLEGFAQASRPTDTAPKVWATGTTVGDTIFRWDWW